MERGGGLVVDELGLELHQMKVQQTRETYLKGEGRVFDDHICKVNNSVSNEFLFFGSRLFDEEKFGKWKGKGERGG